VICPYCNKNLRARQRQGRACAYCRRQYALDPKTNVIRLHDLKVRRLAEKLSAGGLCYTPTQLRYAASRKVINASAPPLLGFGNGLWFLAVSVIIVIVALPSGSAGVSIILGVVGLVVVLIVILHRWRPLE
jgi:hypothetical protein